MTTPTTFTLYKNSLYSGWILRLETPEGLIFGRTAYDPEAARPGFQNEYDYLPEACVGADGNIYTVNSDYDGVDYTVDLVKWVVDWAGAEPSPGTTVVTAIVGGQEPVFNGEMVCYLIPGGQSVQVLFSPYIAEQRIMVAMNPEVGSFVFNDCRMPNVNPSDSVVGLVAGGGSFVATGGQLT